ncbi:MAG: pyridoxal phosphate-dependent aminotransferase, partial [Oscillospiraceae bacterium]|nr:pyridoxal phosphate-dependent aminotransferase [Oscillospiraceae bacterium]
SKIATSLKPSATMAVNATVKQMRAAGVEVFSFGGGEPDWPTPENICQAGIQAIQSGFTKYTPASGTSELRAVIAGRLKDDYGLTYENSQIIVTSGGKHAIYVALCCLLDPGDEVILPAPYWVSYHEAIRMAGGTPVVVYAPEEQGFKLTAAQLEAAVTPSTKLFLLNNPGNPTGAVYTCEELESLATVCKKYDLYVLSDEMYGKLIYDDAELVSFPSLSQDIYERTVLINGVSKSYAMTGWRIGYAAAPKPIAAAMDGYLSQSTGAPPSISQAAALEAFSGPQDAVERMRQGYDERRKYLVERLNSMEGVSCTVPKGAFYLLIDVQAQFGRTLAGRIIKDDADFTQTLLEAEHIAVTPGTAFDAPGYVRWCYASSMEEIVEGLNRLERFIR